jgi:hypothetical protein
MMGWTRRKESTRSRLCRNDLWPMVADRAAGGGWNALVHSPRLTPFLLLSLVIVQAANPAIKSSDPG